MGSGGKRPPSKKLKRPTRAQMAARLRNLPSNRGSDSGNKENDDPSASNAVAPAKPAAAAKVWKHEYEKLRRKYRHSKTRQRKLEAEVSSFKLTDASTRRTADLSAQRVKELSSILEELVAENRKKSTESKGTINTLRGQIKALMQRVRRSIRSLARRVDRARKQLSIRRVTNKGIYTVEARKLARIMVDSGCARGKVGPLMEQIGGVFGLHINRAMSRRTVSVDGWKTRLDEIIDLFNRSPLAQRLAKKYSVRDFLRILKGLNGDHASVEKGTAMGVKDLKIEAAIQELGEKALAGKEFLELVHYLAAWNAKKIAEAGGEDGWNALSPAQQAERDKNLMAEIVSVLGKEAYDALAPEDRRTLDLFIWGGCCMHKDLNSFRGGNAEMMEE
ncbi:hypothetical protein MSAN_02304100 [Mycena sanguinolenta]|uniref:Uncharacterized protein n=1 Tax=Mycena sanguinolenta TaxID=230812 RepID=A0A8H6X963_9AGAR|nr:hypothetical protein MSAN_02304100 [Mycena sanguinolenta]